MSMELNGGGDPTGTAAAEVAVHAALTTGVHGVGTGTIAKTADIPAASSAFPQSTGTASSGTGTAWSRDDHIHSLSNHAHTGDAGDGGLLSGTFIKATTADGSTDAIRAVDSGNAQIFRVDSDGNTTVTGNVGIGTTTPACKCDVNGTFRVTGQLNPASGAGVEVLYDNTIGYIVSYDRTAGAYKDLSIEGLPLYLNAYNGANVGIGTTSPKTSLHIAGAFSRAVPVTETGATHTVAATTTWLICNRAGEITVTLPTAADFAGRELTIKTIQAQTVVSAASNVVPLAGGAAGTAILAATAGKWATLVSNGTNWEIMQGN